MAAHFYILSVFGVVTSVVAAYYYLRVIKVMFFDDSIAALDREPGMGKRMVAAISVVFVVVFVLSPDTLIKSSRDAANALFPAVSTETPAKSE